MSILRNSIFVGLISAITVPLPAFAGGAAPGPFAAMFERLLMEQELMTAMMTETETEIILTAEEAAELGVGESRAVTALRYSLYGVIVAEVLIVGGELGAIAYYNNEFYDYEAEYLAISMEMGMEDEDAIAEFYDGITYGNQYADHYCANFGFMPTCQGWEADKIIASEQVSFIDAALEMGQTEEEAIEEFKDGLYEGNGYGDAFCATYTWICD